MSTDQVKFDKPTINLSLTTQEVTKASIADRATRIVDVMLEYGNEAEIATGVAAIENIVKKVKEDKRYIDAVRSFIGTRGEKGKITLPNGTVMEHAETAISYDYTNDNEWNDLSAQIEVLTEKRKAREAYLKAIPAGKAMVDEETGETAYGPAKTSKSTYKVTLPK